MLNDKLIETYGELAQHLKCSVSYAKKLWLKYGFKLEHRLNKKGRLRMTIDELDRFKKRVQK